MPEKAKVSLPQWLAASFAGIYWQLGLGFMGWQTVAVPMKKGILEPMERALSATYRYENATVAQLGTLYERGIITLKEFVTYLKNLGYDDTAIAIIAHYYTLRIYDDLADAEIARLRDEKDVLEEALYLKHNPKKSITKSLIYRIDEILDVKGWSDERIMKRMHEIDSRIFELKHSLAPDLWNRLSRNLPKITIRWHGIKELLKKKPEEIPAIRVPEEVIRAVPAVPAPEVKPKEIPLLRKREILPKPLEVGKFLNELIVKRIIRKEYFKAIYNAMTKNLKKGKRIATKKFRAVFDGEKWLVEVG